MEIVGFFLSSRQPCDDHIFLRPFDLRFFSDACSGGSEMRLASRAVRIFGIASGLAVMFLHVVVLVFCCLWAVKSSIKSKWFGELEGYESSMSMEYIHVRYKMVYSEIVICSCKNLKTSRLFGTISDLISPLFLLATIPHMMISTWRCSCSFNPQDGVMLTLRVVKAQQRRNCELTTEGPTDEASWGWTCSVLRE